MQNNAYSLLASVSRSFYLSMRFLPACMRDSVAVAYLIARATDTVADTAGCSVSYRLEILALMRDVVDGVADRGDKERCYASLRDDLANTLSHVGEQKLLRCFPLCIDWYHSRPQQEKLLIRQVISTITEGQIWDLAYFEQTETVETEEELTQYTYSVAGCVGEFWTKLAFLTQGSDFSRLPQEKMLELGISFGQGLQLVNILRDREEDAIRGRHYVSPHDDSTYHARLEEATSRLQDGINYARALCGARMRFTTVLPALIGVRTLELLRDDLTGVRVKVPRREIYGMMFRAALFSLRLYRL